jgi:5-methylcytosine-specific restriction protein A
MAISKVCNTHGRIGCDCAKKRRPRTPNRLATMGVGSRGQQWRATRDDYVKLHPTCERCKVKPTHQIHHLDGLGPTGPKGLDPSNLLAVCRSCHALIHDETRPRDEGGHWAAA